jgi:prepilin-type processing-associated H-X9-DG protein
VASPSLFSCPGRKTKSELVDPDATVKWDEWIRDAGYTQDACDDPTVTADNGIPNAADPMRAILGDSEALDTDSDGVIDTVNGLANHGEGANILFLDAHGEYVRAQDTDADGDEDEVPNPHLPAVDKHIYEDGDAANLGKNQDKDADLDDEIE